MHSATFVLVLTFASVHLSDSSGLKTVNADVKGSTLLPCTGTCPRAQPEVKWTVNGGDLVAHYLQGKLTVGPGFEGRVHLSKEVIQGGNFSLSINPVEFSDANVYSCFCNNTQLCEVRLEVLVPAKVSVPVGDPITLPCYGYIKKSADDSQLNVIWEKEGEVVLHLHAGSVTVGPEFESRVSLSKGDIRKGDLSLTFSTTRLSDQGHYQCFYTKEKRAGNPEEVTLTLTAHKQIFTVTEGQDLLLLLHTREPVRVEFSPGVQSTGVPVCVVEGGLPRCEAQYNHRVSIQNGSLQLSDMSPSDSGVYRVMDKRTNSSISINNVDVVDEPFASAGGPKIWPYVLISLLLVTVITGAAFVAVKKRSQRSQESRSLEGESRLDNIGNAVTPLKDEDAAEDL